ncbi:hypothetical protein NIES4103_00960 [Nostoc sp. NIES-4103]|nr:hypothetical protein NIES4103_00960 [Nostoc sp. NIES-4103]
MSEKTSLENLPRLFFLPTQHFAFGVEVDEIDLASSVSPRPCFQASRFTVAPGCSSPSESHHVHEMWIVAQGKGQLHYDHREMQIHQDDFVYFEPHKSHQVINDGSTTMVIFSIWWE